MSLEGITTKLVAVATQTLINKLFKEVHAMSAFFITAGITFLVAFLLIKGVSVWSLLLLAFVSGLVASVSVTVALHFRAKEWKRKTKELEAKTEEWKRKAEEAKKAIETIKEEVDIAKEELMQETKNLERTFTNLEREFTKKIIGCIYHIVSLAGEKVGIAQTKSIGSVEVFKIVPAGSKVWFYWIVPTNWDVDFNEYARVRRVILEHTMGKSEEEAIRIIERL